MNEQKEIKRIIWLSKVLAVLLTILIIIEFMSCAKEAKAATITGETALAGFSLLNNQCIEQTGQTCYPEGISLLAEVMFHENYVNGEEVMYYTGAVVMNRVRSKEFPNTVKKVLYQNNPRQYSTTDKFFTKDIPESVYHLACKVAKGTSDVPSGVLYQAMFQQGKIWKAIPSSYSDEDIEYFCYGR